MAWKEDRSTEYLVQSRCCGAVMVDGGSFIHPGAAVVCHVEPSGKATNDRSHDRRK